MLKKKRTAITGVGTILMVGTVLLVWRKSAKQRAKLVDWKKRRIENMYYTSRDDRDIAWG